MKPEFTHLHIHSDGSLLDGMIQPKKLVKRAIELGQKAVAVTDHGSLFSTITFYKEARDNGVKPLIGIESYMAGGSRFSKEKTESGKNNHHLILIARNNTGYKNLMRMTSKSYLESFYRKPLMDKELLAEHSEGIICLSACLGSEISQYVMAGDIPGARKAAQDHLDIFGHGNYFFELQDHGPHSSSQYKVNEVLLGFSKEMGVPIVATNDSHYVCPDDYLSHDLLLCIQTGSWIDKPDRFKFDCENYYITTTEEMADKFSQYPEALSNTMRIAEMCDVEIEFGNPSLPDFPIPEGTTPEIYLKDLCLEGAPKRFDSFGVDEIARLDYELSVINSKGFSKYFLIVNDFVDEAKKRGISVRARGSAGGSMVAYLLGITNLDPIKYELMFERFLNPDRTDMPDIDLDFADARREEMIDYAIEKYGSDRVAQIGTLGVLGARSAIKDTGRALNIPLQDVGKITGLIQGLDPSIDDCIRLIPEFGEIYKKDPAARDLINRAKGVEGIVKSAGKHAAGVVISADPLTDSVPLQRSAAIKVWRDGEQVALHRAVTQFDMDSISAIGLLKVDFLGLRNLTVVDDCLELIKERHGIDLDLDKIPHEDPATVRMLQEGHTVGVFQCESSGITQMIRDLQPSSFEDMIPVVALYRPGPLQTGMVEQFIKRKHGNEDVSYIDDRLEPILSDTYGVMLYQEHIMKITMAIGGFSAGESEKIRKAMGKKIQEIMDKYQPQFVDGALSHGISASNAVKLYDDMSTYSKYCFNKAHSAAYGALAYETAYLKATYPMEYMSALLTSLMGSRSKLAVAVQECERMGIHVMPPDINKSGVQFIPEGENIRLGLAAIKGMTPMAVSTIVSARNKSSFRSAYDFADRTSGSKINKKAFEVLIKAGSFDDLTPGMRRSMVGDIDKIVGIRKSSRSMAASGQLSLFGSVQNTMPDIKKVQEYSEKELLDLEKEMLGVYISDHPLKLYRKSFDRYGAVDGLTIKEHDDGDMVVYGGIIVDFRDHQTKKGDPMMFMTLEDMTGNMDIVVFKESLRHYRKLIKKENVVLISGKVSVREGYARKKSGDDEEGESPDSRQFSIICDRVITPDVDELDDDGTAWMLQDGRLLKLSGITTDEESGLIDLKGGRVPLSTDKKLVIKLSREQSTLDIIGSIAALISLSDYSGGPIGVEINLISVEGPRLITSGNSGVQPSKQMFYELVNICGEKAVSVVNISPRIPDSN